MLLVEPFDPYGHLQTQRGFNGKLLKEKEQSLARQVGREKNKKKKDLSELATISSDNGGSLAQAEYPCLASKSVLKLSVLFVVIDRQVLNPVASLRTNRNLGQVNFSGASFDWLKLRVLRRVNQSLRDFSYMGYLFCCLYFRGLEFESGMAMF